MCLYHLEKQLKYLMIHRNAFKAFKPQPEPMKFVADNVLLVKFHIKSASCKNALGPFSVITRPGVNVDEHISPQETVKEPKRY